MALTCCFMGLICQGWKAPGQGGKSSDHVHVQLFLAGSSVHQQVQGPSPKGPQGPVQSDPQPALQPHCPFWVPAAPPLLVLWPALHAPLYF